MDGNIRIIEKGDYVITFYPFKYDLYQVKINDTSVRLLPEKRKVDKAIDLIEKLKDLPDNFEYAKAVVSGAVMIAMKYYK